MIVWLAMSSTITPGSLLRDAGDSSPVLRPSMALRASSQPLTDALQRSLLLKEIMPELRRVGSMLDELCFFRARKELQNVVIQEFQLVVCFFNGVEGGGYGGSCDHGKHRAWSRA